MKSERFLSLQAEYTKTLTVHKNIVDPYESRDAIALYDEQIYIEQEHKTH